MTDEEKLALAVALAKAKAAPKPQRMRTMAQGLTLGAADEMEARIRSMAGGRPYEQELSDIRGALESYRQSNPIASMAYEAGGAAIPAVGAALLAPFTGGTSAAAVAPTLGRIGAMAALEGGAYGFNTGEGGFAERALRVPGAAATGAVGGVVGGAAMRGVGGALNTLTDAARRLIGGRGSTVVENEIQRLARQTGKSADQIADDILAGRILAENETIKAAVRAYRASSGDASRIITQAMTPRPAQTRAEAMEEMRKYLSDVAEPSALQAQRRSDDAARVAERAAYGQFRGMTAPQAVVDELAESLKRVPSAANEVAIALRAETGAAPFFEILADGSVKFSRPPTITEAESIRRAISNRVTGLYREGMGGAGEAVKDVERSLRGLLDVEVPLLGATRAQAAAIRGQRDAFEAGRTALAGDINEKLGDFSKITDPEEINAYRAGVMAALEARGATGSRQTMIRSLANEETKEGRLLREVLPPGAQDDVLSRLETARASQVTTDYVLGGSPTSDTLMEAARRGSGGLSISDITGALRADPASMARVASNITDRFARDLTDAERARVARILVSEDANMVRRAIVDDTALAALQQRVQQITSGMVTGGGRAGAVVGAGGGADASQQTIRGLLSPGGAQ
jgi:hypothetical protein